MLSKLKLYDSSHEMLVRRHGNGIKLVSPKDDTTFDSGFDNSSIGNLFSSPINFYLLDTNHVIQNINESTIKNCGFPSVKSTIGHTVEIAARKDTVDFEFDHDREVIRTEQLILRNELYQRLDGSDFFAINIKYPWYSNCNKLIGIFGFSFMIDSVQIAKSLTQASSFATTFSLLMQTKLLAPQNDAGFISRIVKDKMIGNVCLSERSADILRLLIQGKTAKEIAAILKLSPRTVESHLINIKCKFQVNSKSQLIEKVINILNSNL